MLQHGRATTRSVLGFLRCRAAHYLVLSTQWYGLFAVLIPCLRVSAADPGSSGRAETEKFMERTAVIQWGLMICVYLRQPCPGDSLLLPIDNDQSQGGQALMFFVVVCEVCDVLQLRLWKAVCAGISWRRLSVPEKVGRTDGRCRRRHADRRRALVGNAVLSSTGGRDVAGNWPDGLRRRARHVGHQT